MINFLLKPLPIRGKDVLLQLEKLLFYVLAAHFYLFIMVFALGSFSKTLLHPNIPDQVKYETGLPHVYGPVQKNLDGKESYSFDQLFMRTGGFDEVNIDRVSEFSKKELENMILTAVPRSIQGRFSLVIPLAISMAERFQVDPFWVIAIMWTESHFDQFAKSIVDAKGLMQILPNTGHYLTKKLGRNVTRNNVYRMINQPEVNIEFGVFYLKRLLNLFDGNYILATVSYNMGPTRVRRRLRNNLPVGVSNRYLDKVRLAYQKASAVFKQKISMTRRPYELTYVVSLEYNYLVQAQEMRQRKFWKSPFLAGRLISPQYSYKLANK